MYVILYSHTSFRGPVPSMRGGAARENLEYVAVGVHVCVSD